MLSVHEGDIKGVWLAASAPVLTASAPIVGVSLVAKLLTGHGLPVSMLPAPVVHVTAPASHQHECHQQMSADGKGVLLT